VLWGVNERLGVAELRVSKLALLVTALVFGIKFVAMLLAEHLLGKLAVIIAAFAFGIELVHIGKGRAGYREAEHGDQNCNLGHWVTPMDQQS
jgi:hypothetical protein